VSNIPFKDRGKRADDYIQMIRKIWTKDWIKCNYYS